MVRKFTSEIVSSPDGALFGKIGRYMRQEAALVYEMIGGRETFAEWARQNQTEYFTKILPKLIPRETENHTVEKTVDDLLRELDGKLVNITPTEAGDDTAGGAGDARATAGEENESSGVEEEL